MLLRPELAPWRTNPLSMLVFSCCLLAFGSMFVFIEVYHWSWAHLSFSQFLPQFLLISLFELFSLGFGLWLFVLALRTLIRISKLKVNGESCIGRVTEVNTRYLPRYGPQAYLTYSFRVAGKYGTQTGTSGSLSLKQVKQWRSDDEISVRYDPADPEFSIVDLRVVPQANSGSGIRTLDFQQTLAVQALSNNNAAACLLVGFALNLFGLIFASKGLVTAYYNQRFSHEAVSTTGTILRLSWRSGHHTTYHVSYTYTDRSGSTHSDEATTTVPEGEKLSVNHSIPVSYLKSRPETSRLNLPNDQNHYAQEGNILPFFAGFLLVGLFLIRFGWRTMVSLADFQDVYQRPVIKTFHRTY